MLLILVIPAALTYTYGRMVGSQRQGWAIFSAMFVLFIAGVIVVYIAEQHGTAAQHAAGLHTHAFSGSTGGNMEGKEQRFGVAGTSLWAAITTVTSCGAVNGALESLTGFGQLVPFANLSFSEVAFGGVGTGLYSMLLYVILAVFIGGLMVGRTPEYLGKKIGAREIKLVSLGVLVTPLAVLLSSGIASATRAGTRSIYAGINPQGFSETLYAYLSQANNNGSALAGYTGFVQPNAPGNAGSYGISFADLLGGVVMVGARFLPILFVLAVAGALAGKKVSPAGLGTMRTDNPTFVFLLLGHRRPGRRPHLLPRPSARTGGPGPDREALLMKKDLRTGLIAIVVMTLFLGLAYPLAITGISQVAFPGHANGSKLSLDGRVVGSKLIGQEFKGKSYFHSRPSATGYSGNVTFFGNAAPNSIEAREEVREYMKDYLRLEKPYDKSLTSEGVPVDAVTQSASGVDPEISVANARIQAHRVAAVRHLSLSQVEDLISAPHARPLPGSARRARRERPRTQHRPRRRGTTEMN